MEKIDGSSIATFQNSTEKVEDHLFTYSEEERQQNEANAANAKLVFSPEFIPYRVEIKKQFQLTHIETLIYGFIRFYKSAGNGRFYFSNEQIAEIVDCAKSTAANSMAALVRKGLVKTSHKIKSGGGQIRFVTDVFAGNPNPDLLEFRSRTSENSEGNKNKINKNKSIDGLKTKKKRGEIVDNSPPNSYEKQKQVEKAGSPKSIENKVIVDNFQPTCYEEQKLVEWARFLGGDNLGYLVGKYKQGHFGVLEGTIAELRDELDIQKLKNPGAFFTNLVEGKIRVKA